MEKMGKVEFGQFHRMSSSMRRCMIIFLTSNGLMLELVCVWTKFKNQLVEFMQDFCGKLVNLNVHDFIAKQQSSYFNDLKQNLKDDEIIVLMDFSENIALEFHYATQAYYYAKKLCTIHPIFIYFQRNDVLEHKSIIIIAESLTHTAETVYLFITRLVQYLKSDFAQEFFEVKKIFFLTDGAGTQYKKKKFLVYVYLKKIFNSKPNGISSPLLTAKVHAMRWVDPCEMPEFIICERIQHPSIQLKNFLVGVKELRTPKCISFTAIEKIKTKLKDF